MLPFSYSLRNLLVRRNTSIAAAAGIALVVFVLASAQMLAQGLKAAMARTAGADVVVILRKGAKAEIESHIEKEHVPSIAASGLIARDGRGAPLAVGEVVVVVLLDKAGTKGFSNVQIRGVPDNALALRPHFRIVAGRSARPGTNEVVIGRGIRGRFAGVDLNREFELRKNKNVRVVGVFEDNGSSYESEVWGDLDLVRTAFGREAIASVVRAKLADVNSFARFKAEIESSRILGVNVSSELDYFERQSEGTSEFIGVVGTLIAILFSGGAILGAVITMQAAVSNRTQEIGTLRALGFSRRSILWAFLREAVLLSLVAGSTGAAAASLMSFVRISTMNFATWSEIVFSFQPTPQIIGAGVLAGVVLGLLGGVVPALRAALVQPVSAMRG